MNNLRMLRVTALSAGMLGLTALASSAYAQSQPFWPGDPNAPGPAGATAPVYSPPPAPFWFGAPPAQSYATGPTQPYWHGAPNAPGPAS
jgi:hypothetical protein